MQRSKKKAASWPLVVTPAVIFGVGCFADYALSTAVHGPNAEILLPAVAGLTVGTLTVLTFAKRRDAYIVTAALFTAVAVIAVTLAAPAAVRVVLCACSLAVVSASLGAYTLVPVPKTATVRAESQRKNRPQR